MTGRHRTSLLPHFAPTQKQLLASQAQLWAPQIEVCIHVEDITIPRNDIRQCMVITRKFWFKCDVPVFKLAIMLHGDGWKSVLANCDTVAFWKMEKVTSLLSWNLVNLYTYSCPTSSASFRKKKNPLHKMHNSLLSTLLLLPLKEWQHYVECVTNNVNKGLIPQNTSYVLGARHC